MDRSGDIAFSAHQNTQNEHKETLYKKGQNNDSFNIWIRQHFTIASLFLSSWQNEAFQISYIISR